MGYNSIPPRWEEYRNMGKVIPGTQIITFKVPLRKEICDNLSNKSKSFTTGDLIRKGKEFNLSLVIDLTMTTRFYRSEDLEREEISYVKFAVMGGGNMPRESEVSHFCNIVSNHIQNNPNGVVGVHCTHGLNRTGYFVCRYMIDCLGFPGPYAVKLFERCRGHEFDRLNYRDFLCDRMPTIIAMPPPLIEEDSLEESLEETEEFHLQKDEIKPLHSFETLKEKKRKRKQLKEEVEHDRGSNIEPRPVEGNKSKNRKRKQKRRHMNEDEDNCSKL